MSRALRYVGLFVLGVVGLFVVFVALPIGLGVVVGYLNAPKAAPPAIEIVHYRGTPPAKP